MTDTHVKKGIMAYNMIFEQNMMKLVAGKKDIKLSCFGPPIWHFGGHFEKEDGHFE